MIKALKSFEKSDRLSLVVLVLCGIILIALVVIR
jgi:hypothetical protein